MRSGLLIAALLAACTTTGPDTAWTEPRWPEPDIIDAGAADPDVVVADWDTEGAGPLTGFYVIEADVTAMVLGLEFPTKQILLARFLQQGTTLRQSLTLCHLDLPSVDGLVELRVPDHLRELLQAAPSETQEESLSSPDPGATWSPAPIELLIGAELSSPGDDLPGEGAPLCADSDPPCLDDPDEDGNPGVALEADVAALCAENPQRLDIVLRVELGFEGIVGPGHDTLQGTVSPVLEWTVVGLSDACLEPARELVAEPGEGSTFTAYRTDAVACSQVELPEPTETR